MSSDAPAFSSTMSRGAPAVAVSTSRAMRAFSVASPPRKRLGRGLRQADVGRMHVERVDRAVAVLRHLRVAGRRDLVEAVGAVHDPGARRSQQPERSRHELGQFRPRHADQLPRGARGVGQRAEQVEGRPHAEVLPRRRRRDASTDGRSARRRTRCRPPPGTVRRPPAGAVMLTPSASKRSALPQRLDTDRLPCFATVHAARRDDERRDGRDVERVRAVAAGAAGVEDVGIRARQASSRARAWSGPARRPPTDARPSSPARSSRPAICAGCARPSMISSMAAADSSTVRSCRRCSFSIKRGEHHISRKLRSSFRPSTVRTDSGWNCTP